MSRDRASVPAARRLAIAPIAAYQRVVSPLLGQRCRYHPSCSCYAAQAIEEHGIVRGAVLGVWRILRCNPWSPGGDDPVSAQRVFGSRRRSVRPRPPAARPGVGSR